MPFLKGGPVHVDVGFVRQVNLTRSPENSPSLIHILRLQVLSVLNNKNKNMSHTSSKLLFLI